MEALATLSKVDPLRLLRLVWLAGLMNAVLPRVERPATPPAFSDTVTEVFRLDPRFPETLDSP
jgi:hypothetical protein